MWPNGLTDQDKTWHAGRPRPWPHCVRWVPSSPSPKGGGQSPQFSAHICCGKMAGWIKMPLGTEVGLGAGLTVLDGDPAPPPKKGLRRALFLAHFCCGQMAECIKMPRGMEVGLIPGDFVFDGDSAPPQKGGGAPNFPPISIVAKRLHGSRCHLLRR